jgi:hypothetical protein
MWLYSLRRLQSARGAKTWTNGRQRSAKGVQKKRGAAPRTHINDLRCGDRRFNATSTDTSPHHDIGAIVDP